MSAGWDHSPLPRSQSKSQLADGGTRARRTANSQGPPRVITRIDTRCHPETSLG
jgi:hypothetical protein